jgi:hypothetical protein
MSSYCVSETSGLVFCYHYGKATKQNSVPCRSSSIHPWIPRSNVILLQSKCFRTRARRSEITFWRAPLFFPCAITRFGPLSLLSGLCRVPCAPGIVVVVIMVVLVSRGALSSFIGDIKFFNVLSNYRFPHVPSSIYIYVSICICIGTARDPVSGD